MVQAQPGQFLVEDLALFLGEIAVLHAPIRNGAADAMDELPHGSLAFRRVLFTVEIF